MNINVEGLIFGDKSLFRNNRKQFISPLPLFRGVTFENEPVDMNRKQKRHKTMGEKR
jgi:hypothetical protein